MQKGEAAPRTVRAASWESGSHTERGGGKQGTKVRRAKQSGKRRGLKENCTSAGGCLQLSPAGVWAAGLSESNSSRSTRGVVSEPEICYSLTETAWRILQSRVRKWGITCCKGKSYGCECLLGAAALLGYTHKDTQKVGMLLRIGMHTAVFPCSFHPLKPCQLPWGVCACSLQTGC